MPHEQEKPLEERLQDLADKLCKVSSLMYILTRTLYQECIGSEFDKAIRTAPNTDGKILGVAHRGDTLPYGGRVSDGGWLLVQYKGQNAWVSGKYGRIG